MTIHLRDPHTSIIQFKTLCGYYIVRMAMTEKWTFKVSIVDCPWCLKAATEQIREQCNKIYEEIEGYRNPKFTDK